MTKLPMVCSCGDEGKREVAATYHAWLKSLPDLQIRDPVISVDWLVMEMSARYGGAYTLLADQWFGVHYKLDNDDIYVECDRLEDGLIAIMQELHKRHGATRYHDEDEADENEDSATEQSSDQEGAGLGT